MNYYIISSLELHLFFGRIMKEHSFFLEVGYTQANCDYIKEASKFKKAFEKLLYDVIGCSEGVVDDTIFKAGEVITEYTLPSEVKTSHFTGSEIDENITKLEVNLWKNSGLKRGKIDSGLVKRVERINQRCL